jgi:hypothetical protein
MIRLTQKMEATRSTETSVLTRAIRRHIPEDGIFIFTAVKTSDLTNYNLNHVIHRPSQVIFTECACPGKVKGKNILTCLLN